MPVSKVYKHADTYDTKCKICDKNEIGDEFHYLFICPVFQEDRNRLLKEYYRKFPSMYKFIELMSTTNIKDLRKLAQFATIIIRKFQNTHCPVIITFCILNCVLHVALYIFRISAMPKKDPFENKPFIHLFILILCM